MKSRFITILAACGCASLAHAQFNPVALTPQSYTESVVVPATYSPALPNIINVTAGQGLGFGDTTFYEQGYYNSQPGQVGYNTGIPKHNTVFTNINNSSITYLMPPDYTTNNDFMVDSSFTTTPVTFNSPMTASQLSVLATGGGGQTTFSYTANHADGSADTGSITVSDWFGGGSTVAWGANGRVGPDGGYANFNSSTINNNPPYLYGANINVSSSSPITNIVFTYSSGQHASILAISGLGTTSTWIPIPLSGYNCQMIAWDATNAYPVTATMDQGTNIVNNGNGMNTWYESGYDNGISSGLPASGSTFTSFSQPSHTYQMGDYSTNDSILVDTNHQVANITPASPQVYTAFAFLTAGGNIGAGNVMTNVCVLQHQDGVQETNLFFAYDWYDTKHPGALAYEANGRVNMQDRSINSVGNPDYPYLFESYFTLADSSPVTNIVVKYLTAPGASATTFIMAVSASTTGVPPVVSTGPVPGSVTVYPGQTTSFEVGLTGTQPITGYWQVDNAGNYSTLNDGIDANGSTIIGSHTTTLTISNIYPADATNYQYVANNSFGSGVSQPAVLIVSPQTVTINPGAPAAYESNNVPLAASISGGPAVGWQWFYFDNSGDGITNLIPGATNSTYIIPDVQLSQSGYFYGVIATNTYSANTALVPLSVSTSQAFLVSDLSPTNAEAYAGTLVTYVVNAAGNSPISYQWIVNGSVVSGATNASYTLAAPCGTTTVQASISNLLSDANGGPILTSEAILKGDSAPTNLTFINNGAGWVTNGNGATGSTVPNFTNGVLMLTDGTGGEGSSAFFPIAQYVGGAWTASYIYNSHAGSADGTAFILQNMPTGPHSLGGSGGELGYGGITNSMAFEINLYNGNGETPGINGVINGLTGTYFTAAPAIDVNGTNDIDVVLNWNNGVLSATLTDAVTLDTYSTNYNIGPLVPILGGNFAYIGFSGGDGGATSTQTVRNFQFHSIVSGGSSVKLGVATAGNNSVVITWPTADSGYALQVSTSLSSPSWVNGPAPTTVGTNNQITITTGTGSAFYRLVHSACQ